MREADDADGDCDELGGRRCSGELQDQEDQEEEVDPFGTHLLHYYCLHCHYNNHCIAAAAVVDDTCYIHDLADTHLQFGLQWRGEMSAAVAAVVVLQMAAERTLHD